MNSRKAKTEKTVDDEDCASFFETCASKPLKLQLYE